MNDGQRSEVGSTLVSVGRTLRGQMTILFGLVFLAWLLEILDFVLFDGALDSLGVQPRSLTGLRGVLLMPFLHNGFRHLLANTVPFFILGWLVMIRRTADFYFVSAVVMVVGGLGTWLFGPAGSVHIGASGVIFGYFGFLLLRGYFERGLFAILMAIVVTVLYGGLLWGVLPLQDGVSWQAHFFGFLGGVAAAYLLSPRFANA